MKPLSPLLTLAALTALAVTPASAIECQGNFQIQKNGNEIATPYCQDNYLAIVARESGMRVSAGAIRANPSVKERACRFVGYDIRVKDTCAPYLGGHGRGYWR
ncbi:MAG: hypothetical protein HC850_03420 [Rhodomicrobium sp.]|nr:hypothetical protein [Rhodomicrobium sp.]